MLYFVTSAAMAPMPDSQGASSAPATPTLRGTSIRTTAGIATLGPVTSPTAESSSRCKRELQPVRRVRLAPRGDVMTSPTGVQPLDGPVEAPGDRSTPLHRSTTNRVFAGVCGGIAEHFGSDP